MSLDSPALTCSSTPSAVLVNVCAFLPAFFRCTVMVVPGVPPLIDVGLKKKSSASMSTVVPDSIVLSLLALLLDDVDRALELPLSLHPAVMMTIAAAEIRVLRMPEH